MMGFFSAFHEHDHAICTKTTFGGTVQNLSSVKKVLKRGGVISDVTRRACILEDCSSQPPRGMDSNRNPQRLLQYAYMLKIRNLRAKAVDRPNEIVVLLWQDHRSAVVALHVDHNYLISATPTVSLWLRCHKNIPGYEIRRRSLHFTRRHSDG